MLLDKANDPPYEYVKEMVREYPIIVENVNYVEMNSELAKEITERYNLSCDQGQGVIMKAETCCILTTSLVVLPVTSNEYGVGYSLSTNELKKGVVGVETTYNPLTIKVEICSGEEDSEGSCKVTELEFVHLCKEVLKEFRDAINNGKLSPTTLNVYHDDKFVVVEVEGFNIPVIMAENFVESTQLDTAEDEIKLLEKVEFSRIGPPIRPR